MTLQELGQSIREQREATGVSLQDVSSRIKISSRILKSIEEGSLAGLPHAVYTKSFIRAFGAQIGYDQEKLNEALEKIFPPEALNEAGSMPVFKEYPILPYPGGAAKRFAVLLALLLFLAGIVVGGWYVAVTYGEQMLDMVKKPFSAITAPVEGDTSSQVFAPSPATSNRALSRALQTLSGAKQPASQRALFPSPGRDAPLGSAAPASGTLSSLTSSSPAFAGVAASGAEETALPGEDSPAADAVARPLANAGDAGAVDPRDAAPATGRETGAPNRLVILAEELCWLGYRVDGAGERGYTVKPGERFALTYEATLELTFGNAGGVMLAHNGKELGRPGQKGRKAVLRFPESGR